VAQQGAHLLKLRGERMAISADGKDWPAMHVGSVFRDVLPLTTDAPGFQFIGRSSAHDANVAVSRPHFIEFLAHRVIGATLLVVLLQIDDAVISPWHARSALATYHLKGVVVRIAFDDDATSTTVTRSLLKSFELFSGHEDMMKRSRPVVRKQRLRRGADERAWRRLEVPQS
jgi:hypothetical protein